MVLFDKIPLANGLILELWDASKQDALGLWTVNVVARCKVEIKEEYFKEFKFGTRWYKYLLENKGRYIVYEQQKTKQLVHSSERDKIFNILTERLKQHILPYVSNHIFPKALILRALSETVRIDTIPSV